MTEQVVIRAFGQADLAGACAVWNMVVAEGNAFPETDPLDEVAGKAFFASQSAVGVAVEEGDVVGLYILHPNNIGRCSHIANAGYAVSPAARGRGIGRALVQDSLSKTAELGFTGLQFNAVVEGNRGARKLYESLGFDHIGTIPKGFRHDDGALEDICIYYHDA